MVGSEDAHISCPDVRMAQPAQIEAICQQHCGFPLQILLGKHTKLLVFCIFLALKMTDPVRLQSTSPGSKKQLFFNFQHMKSNQNLTVNKYFYLKYGGSSLLCLFGVFSWFYGNL